LELFGERGFDRTTVAQIAQRAGLNERSFYRYFTDKREVLFRGGDELESHLTKALREAPPDEGPLDAVLAAIAGAGVVFRPIELLRIRERVINANPQLRERELIKMDTIYAALMSALRERGADETTARLATDMGMSVWRAAAERLRHSDDATLAAHVRESFAAEVRDVGRHLRRIAAGAS
jgi:AcrR family transcriptional regulator